MADEREGTRPGGGPEGRARLEEKVAARWGELARRTAERQEWTLSPELEASICAATMSAVRDAARDVRQFARHAGRDVVQVEDVSLCARRNPSLRQALEDRLHVHPSL